MKIEFYTDIAKGGSQKLIIVPIQFSKLLDKTLEEKKRVKVIITDETSQKM
jgi:preprotein translocase subunit SecB